MYVSIGALVLLIIVLIVIGVSMSSFKSLTSFPPTQNACPDYWDVGMDPNVCGIPTNGKNIGQIVFKSDKSGVDPTNANNIGMCSGTKSFGCVDNGEVYLPANAQSNANFKYVKLNNNANTWGTLYPGVSERCAQRKWANTMGITWDGVTNFNGC